MSSFKNLIAWQKAHQLAIKIYKITESFPKQEMFGITSQLRRAALSVPTNLVEGYSRKSHKEFLRFIDIARGSLAEVEYLLYFSTSIKLTNEDEILEVIDLINETGKILWGLQKTIGRSP